MMDVVTGKTRPDEGEVYFEGAVDLTKEDEAAIAELGIGRKFQKPTVFEGHTLWDNLELALKNRRGVFATLFHSPSREEQARIAIVLVEQYLDFARQLADKIAIMDRGEIVFSGAAADLDEQAVRRHLTV